MQGLRLNSSVSPALKLQIADENPNRHDFPSKSTNAFLSFSPLNPNFRFNCASTPGDDVTPLSSSSAFTMLGVEPGCSALELKAAFLAKVKEFHPDVNRTGEEVPDIMILRVIQAYEILSKLSRCEIIESECLEPFDKPEWGPSMYSSMRFLV